MSVLLVANALFITFNLMEGLAYGLLYVLVSLGNSPVFLPISVVLSILLQIISSLPGGILLAFFSLNHCIFLLRKKNPRGKLRIFIIISLVVSSFSLISPLAAKTVIRTFDNAYSVDEAKKLIADCKVNSIYQSFKKNAIAEGPDDTRVNQVNLEFKQASQPGKHIGYAYVDDFNALRDAGKSAENTCGIFLIGEGPKNITNHKAADLINSCKINAVYYGNNEILGTPPLPDTGDGYNVLGNYKDEINARKELIPLAREARKKCHNLQIHYYEELKNGKYNEINESKAPKFPSLNKGYITMEEAKRILGTCKTRTLYYRNNAIGRALNEINKYDYTRPVGTSIGILLTSEEEPFEMHISDDMIPTVVPIAEEAQKECPHLELIQRAYEEKETDRNNYKEINGQINGYISIKEATERLKACNVQEFYYTNDAISQGLLYKQKYRAEGPPPEKSTGILFIIDKMFIKDDLIQTILPIALEAQKKCSYLQLIQGTIASF